MLLIPVLAGMAHSAHAGNSEEEFVAAPDSTAPVAGYRHLSLFSNHFSDGGYELELFHGPAFTVPTELTQLDAWASGQPAKKRRPKDGAMQANTCWVSTHHARRPSMRSRWVGVGYLEFDQDLLHGEISFGSERIKVGLFMIVDDNNRPYAEGALEMVGPNAGIKLCNAEGCSRVTDPPSLTRGPIRADADIAACFDLMRSEDPGSSD